MSMSVTVNLGTSEEAQANVMRIGDGQSYLSVHPCDGLVLHFDGFGQSNVDAAKRLGNAILAAAAELEAHLQINQQVKATPA